MTHSDTMKPSIQVIEDDEEQTAEIGNAIAEREVGINTVNGLITATGYHEEDRLLDAVKRNADVVERALEEDVFVGEIRIPGWFVNNDEELSEEHGHQHPGASLRIRGLVEDYSDKAWRIVAAERDELPGLIYEYEWTFVPKSQVAMIRLLGVDDVDTADQVSRVTSEIRRDPDADWTEMSWNQKLRKVDNRLGVTDD